MLRFYFIYICHGDTSTFAGMIISESTQLGQFSSVVHARANSPLPAVGSTCLEKFGTSKKGNYHCAAQTNVVYQSIFSSRVIFRE